MRPEPPESTASSGPAWRRSWRSLRLAGRIFFAFLGIIVLSMTASAIAGAVLISQAVRSETQARVAIALKNAHLSLEERQRSLLAAAELEASGGPGRDVTLAAARPQLIRLSADTASRLGISAGSYGFLSAPAGELEAAGLAVGSGLPSCAGGNLLCLYASAAGSRGVVLALEVLNGDEEVVSSLQERLFGSASYGNKPFGTVTIFCGDTRVATTVIGPNGQIALGTRVSEIVRRKVLVEGGTWLDRALVVDAWYLSGYEPVRDSRGRAVGILYVGVLERRYLDVRNRALAILLLLAVPALGLLLWGAWLVARSVTSPLGSLAEAAQAVARGQLDLRVAPVNGGLEVDYLARAFESMVDAVREREARLTSQNLELEAANRDYQELLDFVTHELNNSIGSLLLNTSILADESRSALSGEQREIVDQLERDISRARDMVRNYLSLSRLERGSLRSHPSPVEVRSRIIEPVLKRLDRWIRHAAVRVDWDWPREVTVLADADLLDICFSNLAVNALKYGRDWIRFSAERDGAGWRMAVANGGTPIPPEKVRLLFRKFSRLVSSDDGAGLGLYLVRTIVERQGGRVWCESGVSTTFVLWMPAP